VVRIQFERKGLNLPVIIL